MSETVATASLLIDTLRHCGVRHVFANFGSDHPAIIEALARDRENGITTPSVVLCPHEYTALSAAHAYAAVTGEPQAVFVHTDVGTANLGGAVHNAARSRAPVFIFAGLTPFALEGELPGARNTHINYLQDAPDQHGLVRQYVKWTYDIRTGRNVSQLVLRGLQLAKSAPAGPVYLTGAREVLAEEVPRTDVSPHRWKAVAPTPPPPEIVHELVGDLVKAHLPLIITTYLGRDKASVDKLVHVAEKFGIGVVEYNAEVLSFPHDHPLHLGDDPHRVIQEADLILALDTDVPWLSNIASPGRESKIYVVNEDPLQENIPLWYLPAHHFVRANGASLLGELAETASATPSTSTVEERSRRTAAKGRAFRAEWEQTATGDVEEQRLTVASVCYALSQLIDDDAIVLNEAISEAPTVWKHLPRRLPGTLFGNRGTSLGWSGGGALGTKLAARHQQVISLLGDGTFFFSVPSSTYWVSDRYRIPFLTVVLDNGGWNATKRNLTRQHAGGKAEEHDRYWVNLQQSSDFSGIAKAAGHAWGATVTEFEALRGTLAAGLDQIAEGRSAVVTVRLPPISGQPEEPW